MREKYSEYIHRKKHNYGYKFDDSELDKRFIPYFESGQRIKVKFIWGEELTGTIGVTTGWRPCFLLMRTTRSIGSPYVLRDSDELIAVKVGRKYITMEDQK